MEQQAIAENLKASTSLSLSEFEPVNEYLVCRAAELPEYTSGGIIIPDSSKELYGGRAEIMLVSQNLNPMLNKFKPGQLIIYSKNAQKMDLWIDEEKFFLIHKRDVGAIVKK